MRAADRDLQSPESRDGGESPAAALDSSRPATAGRRAAWLTVLGGYLVSRLAFRALGPLDLDASSLSWFWQFLDPELLRSDALRSLYLLHAQPPAFNGALALAGKICGESARSCLNAGLLTSGGALHLGMFALMVRLATPPWIAVAVTTLFAVSPASLLYESWIFYTYPVTALLVAAAVWSHRCVAGGGRRRDLLVYSALLAVVVLTRSLFHLLWMAAMLAPIAWAVRPTVRRVAHLVTIPFFVCFALYAKNAVEFGTFSSSSWLGMSLARLAIEPLPMNLRATKFASGDLSSVAGVTPFSDLENYPAAMREIPDWAADHAALRARRKSTGAVNFNHVGYLAISRAYLRDSLRMISDRPDAYARSVGEAWMTFFQPPSRHVWLSDNRDRIAVYERGWNNAVYGFTEGPCGTERSEEKPDGRSCLRLRGVAFLMLAFAAVLGALIVGVRQTLAPAGNHALGATLLFCSGTTIWVAVVGNALELGENNRFRFMVEPLIFAQVAWFAAAALSRGNRVPGTGSTK